MKKQIIDYLPLYPNCRVHIDRGEFDETVGIAKQTSDGFRRYAVIRNDGKVIHVELVDIKMYLRPLSSMTDQEKAELVAEVTYNHVDFSSMESALACFDNEQYKKPIQHQQFYVDEVNWLRKKFFDIDKLIDSGLAIDETINPPII